MNELPQEIVDNVCSYLDHDSLKSILLLSEKLQYAAEQYSEAFRIFTLTANNIEKFIATYSGRRFRYLRQLEFRPFLPAPERDEDLQDWDSDDNQYRESQEELQNIDAHFTSQIRLLFSTMKAVETHSCNEKATGYIHLKLFTPTMNLNPNMWPLQRLFVTWRVHLLTPETLPMLTSVRELTIQSPDQTWYRNGPHPSLRKLDLRVLLDLSGKLPNLSALRCRIGADELYSNTLSSEPLRYITQDWIGPRKDSRSGFGKALEGLALHNLRHVCLDFLYPQFRIQHIDQGLPMPNLTAPSLLDPLSTSLRILSQQLRAMQFRVIADATLFWPGEGDTPHWPNLEHLQVEFHMSTPAGSWYFNKPPGIQVGAAKERHTVAQTEFYPPLIDTEKDDALWEETCEMDLEEAQTGSLQFRVVPNDAKIVPFLTAFAKAVAQMPRLKTFALWSPLTFSLDPDDGAYKDFDFATVSSIPKHVLYAAKLAWGIAYTNPHERPFPDNSQADFSIQRRMWWRTGTWRPHADLLESLNNIGKEQYRGDMLNWFDD
ncbi:hypothetical protein BU25DRAFT_300726, partial [Macroventuria anomochaeta]